VRETSSQLANICTYIRGLLSLMVLINRNLLTVVLLMSYFYLLIIIEIALLNMPIFFWCQNVVEFYVLFISKFGSPNIDEMLSLAIVYSSTFNHFYFFSHANNGCTLYLKCV